jgi:hypothetical protein
MAQKTTLQRLLALVGTNPLRKPDFSTERTLDEGRRREVLVH